MKKVFVIVLSLIMLFSFSSFQISDAKKYKKGGHKSRKVYKKHLKGGAKKYRSGKKRGGRKKYRSRKRGSGRKKSVSRRHRGRRTRTVYKHRKRSGSHYSRRARRSAPRYTGSANRTYRRGDRRRSSSRRWSYNPPTTYVRKRVTVNRTKIVRYYNNYYPSGRPARVVIPYFGGFNTMIMPDGTISAGLPGFSISIPTAAFGLTISGREGSVTFPTPFGPITINW